MAKARSFKIRNHGAIPERRHDAFLLALLLAIVLNITFFAVQAIVPRLSYLLQALGPDVAQQDEEEALPFVLVDPSLFDEPVDDTPPDAESLVDREARQVESMPQLPVDKPYVEEGVEELSTMLDGAPGPAESATVDAPDSAPSEANDQEPSDSPAEQPAEAQEAPEETPPEETAEPAAEPVAEPVAEPPPEQPAPEPPPEAESPPPPPPSPPEPEPFVPPPPMEAEQLHEPTPEPPPEIVPEVEPLPEPVEETPPEREMQPDPVEPIELAALPVAPDGFLDPQRQYLEELARREELARQQRQWEERQRQEQLEQMRRQEYLEQQRRQEEYERRQMEEMARRQEVERQRQEEYQRQVQEQYERQMREEAQRQMQQQQQQRPEATQPRSREGRPQPTFRKIGQGSEASAPSRRGGAPRKRNMTSSVNLLDSDPNMKYLAHKYAAYMKKLAELLQQSLNREVILQPSGYTVGQARIRFTIAADGTLGYYATEYPEDLNYIRITSENTLINAGPFDPPTAEMLADPVFKQMSLTVNLY